jgi:hypothetical protein
MFARITSGAIPPGKTDEYSRTMREVVIPRARELSGFRGGHWLIDQDAGKATAAVLFEDRRSVEASREDATSICEAARARLGAPELKVEECEVIASVDAEERLAA